MPHPHMHNQPGINTPAEMSSLSDTTRNDAALLLGGIGIRPPVPPPENESAFDTDRPGLITRAALGIGRVATTLGDIGVIDAMHGIASVSAGGVGAGIRALALNAGMLEASHGVRGAGLDGVKILTGRGGNGGNKASPDGAVGPGKVSPGNND